MPASHVRTPQPYALSSRPRTTTPPAGKFGEAEGYAQRAVESLRLGVGPDDVSTATALYNLAGLSKRQGKLGAAADAYGAALRIFRERLGEGVGETADTLYQMGGLAKRMGDLAEAARCFSGASDAYAAAYGADDKRVVEAAKKARAAADKVSKSTSTPVGSTAAAPRVAMAAQ